jgi:hypothetical protein
LFFSSSFQVDHCTAVSIEAHVYFLRQPDLVLNPSDKAKAKATADVNVIEVSESTVLSVPEFTEVIVLSEEAMCVFLGRQDFEVLKAGNTGPGKGEGLQGKKASNFISFFSKLFFFINEIIIIIIPLKINMFLHDLKGIMNESQFFFRFCLKWYFLVPLPVHHPTNCVSPIISLAETLYRPGTQG